MPKPLSPQSEEVARGYARHFSRNLPTHLDPDDFLSVALIAAWKAEATFDSSRGASLQSWVRGKVWRALVEQLRAEDHLTRYQRKGRGEQQLPARYQRPVWIDRPVKDLQRGSLAEMVPGSSLATRDGYTLRLLTEEVWCFLFQLEPRDREILLRHYWLGETMTAIGATFGVKRTRGQQLCAQSLDRLRQLYLETPGRLHLSTGGGSTR